MAESSKNDDLVVLVGIGESYWLLEGEPYLSAVLSAEEYYPTPIICRSYKDMYELQMDMPEGTLVGNLWAVNPLIIARLHKQKHIVIEEK